MNVQPGGKRSSAWIWVVVALAVPLVIAAVCAFTILSRRMPDDVQLSIEERFATQIECLRELAASHRTAPLTAEVEALNSDSRLPPIPPIASKEWRRRAKDAAGLFTDPMILGAAVITEETERSKTLDIVKAFELPSPSWNLSQHRADIDRPAVSLWFAGGVYVVEYGNRFLDPEGTRRGYRMYLDLSLLEGEE